MLAAGVAAASFPRLSLFFFFFLFYFIFFIPMYVGQKWIVQADVEIFCLSSSVLGTDRGRKEGDHVEMK